MSDHERIWLSAYFNRCWNHENLWGDKATEYVRADVFERLREENEQLRMDVAIFNGHRHELLEVFRDITELAEKACDLCGITRHSDIRIFAEQAAKVAVMADRERRPTMAETLKITVTSEQARNELARREDAGVDPRIPLTPPENVGSLSNQQLKAMIDAAIKEHEGAKPD